MTCKNCGKEINDGSVFCPYCGTVQASAQNATPAWEGPEGGGKKKKTGLIAGVAVAAVAVVAALAVALSGVFASPKGKVEKAFAKSAAAFAAAEKKLGLPDTAQWQKDQKVTQNMALELISVNGDLVGVDLSALSGLKIGLGASYSGPDRWLSADLWAGWGEDDLLDLSLKADDSQLYLSSPQLTGETSYGVNTETLGTDLKNLTGDDSMEDLSFNLFDLVDLALKEMDQEKLKQDLLAATKALWDQAEVKKTGSKTLSINGTDVKTTAYQVTIPEEALDQYMDDLEDVLSAFNYYDLYEEIYRSMGMPQEQIDEIMETLELVDPYGALADSLRDAVAEIGDLELEVCLSGGHVSGMLYADKLDGTDLSLALYLGGGEEYVDDLSLELEVDGASLTVTSTGDHGGRSGIFTDKTTIKGDPLRAASLTSIVSELSYEPKGKSDNFSWELSIPGAGSLKMSGSLDAQSDYLALDLDDITLKAMGIEVCTLSFSYQAEGHAGRGTVDDPKIITQMDQLELMMTALDIQQNAEAWMGEMEDLFSARLGDLFWLLQGSGVYY